MQLVERHRRFSIEAGRVRLGGDHTEVPIT
jgi:hypothetical protein